MVTGDRRFLESWAFDGEHAVWQDHGPHIVVGGGLGWDTP